MTIVEVREWFETGKGRVKDEQSLRAALVDLGVDEKIAKLMFRSIDASLHVLHLHIDDMFNGNAFRISGGETIYAEYFICSSYQKFHTKPLWRGVAHHGNVYLACVLLALCVLCYPKETYGILDMHECYLDCHER